MKRCLAACLVMLALLPSFALAAPVTAAPHSVISAGIAGYDRLYEDMSVVLACDAYEHKVFAVTPDNDGTYRFLAYIREATETNRAQMTFCVYDTDGNCLYRSAPAMRVKDLSLRADKAYIFDFYFVCGDVESLTADVFFSTVSSVPSARLFMDAAGSFVKSPYLVLQNRFVYTIPKLTPVSDDGGRFLGWSDRPGEGTAPLYRAGDPVEPLVDRVLYPVWETAPTTGRLLTFLRRIANQLRVRIQIAILCVRKEIVFTNSADLQCCGNGVSIHL